MVISNQAILLQIYYASQKGTAQSIAEDMRDDFIDKNIICELSCISHLNISYLKSDKAFIFVGSTTGDGEPPDTARKLMREIRKMIKSNETIDHFDYTVLGLGDTNYTNFCNFGQTLDKYLGEIGGKRFHPSGWADDDSGLEIVVDPWMKQLFLAFNNLLVNRKKKINCDTDVGSENAIISLVAENTDFNENKMYPYSKKLDTDIIYENYETMIKTFPSEDVMTIDEINDHPLLKTNIPNEAKLTIPPAPLRYLHVDLSEKMCENFIHKEPFSACASNLLDCYVESFRSLAGENSSRDTTEIKLSLPPQTESQFEPGDSFAIFPENSKEEVNLFISLLGLRDISHYRCLVSLDPNNKKRNAQIPSHLLQETSLKDLVSHCLDFRSVPKKPFIRALIDYTSNHIEKRKLMELVSREFPSTYIQQVREKNICLLDLLLIFRSCKPTLALIFEHLPKLNPRSYSTTSSPLQTKSYITFAFHVVDIKKDEYITFNRKGICTGWLQKLCKPKLTDNLDAKFRKLDIAKNIASCKIYQRCNQNFRLPENHSTPVIMIGPGTGVAPFIGFLRHKFLQSTICGTSILFFGCRTEVNDFIFRKELDDFIQNETLTQLYTCYSRQSTNNNIKYVQDNIIQHRNEVCRLICEENAMVYVCGDARNMARDVMEAFVEVIKTHMNLTQSDARSYIAQLQLDKRYLQDVWA